MAKILVVDDTPETLELLRVILGVTPHTCVYARSGREAKELYLSAIRQHDRFDLVILDMMMPDIKGCDVAHWIQEEWGDYETKILLTSAYAGNPEAQACARSLGSEVTTKPDCLLEIPGIAESMLNSASRPADLFHYSGAR